MLYLLTDLEDKRWLEYILEEFRRINRAEFPIRVCGLSEDIGGAKAIFYTRSFTGLPAVPNKSAVMPDGRTKYLGEDIFILPGTEGSDPRFDAGYDFFWNAFVFLSRYEEYLTHRSGRRIASLSLRHPRQDKTTFDIPVVNNIFNGLEKLISDNFPSLGFGAKQSQVVELSHDIDYLRKTLKLRIKRTAFDMHKIARGRYGQAGLMQGLSRTARFIFSAASYRYLDYWGNLEKKYQRRSVFYVYAGSGRKGPRAWLVDPSYDISKEGGFLQKIKQLRSEGFGIGLHGSFGSAVNEDLLRREKQALENLLEFKVDRVRQHWLRYEEDATPHIHNKLFAFDATLGWNDRMGFRSGVLSLYRPYDHRNKAAFDFFAIPQVIMDSHLFDYNTLPLAGLEEQAAALLASLGKYKTAHVTLCWHLRGPDREYGWNSAYERLLNV